MNKFHVVVDQLLKGMGLSSDSSQFNSFLGDQLLECVKLVLSLAINWSAELWWRWDHGTSEDSVQVVNWPSSSWRDVSDSSDNLLGSDQSSVDLVNHVSLMMNLSSQSVDHSVDLSGLLDKNVLLVYQVVYGLLDDLDLVWPWWLNNDSSWWS